MSRPNPNKSEQYLRTQNIIFDTTWLRPYLIFHFPGRDPAWWGTAASSTWWVAGAAEAVSRGEESDDDDDGDDDDVMM